ncbi:hypothetical protein CVT24_010747 [Panaeolus cyanescens]|uniref:MARVEL domain-containing protein n=1 Tax=Panaeolus cyanescens TaxID=181874 RepID=A0A409YM97_9AGAR|nr:hypothetical protein CVT24_010747 [Panaeolus cyanescens]
MEPPPTPATGGIVPKPQPAGIKKVFRTLGQHWLYISVAIFLSVLNIIMGVGVLSYVHPKKTRISIFLVSYVLYSSWVITAIIFGIVCFGMICGLGHFASLCYLLQRSKDEFSDLTIADTAYSVGVMLLFAIAGLAYTAELPSRCYSGPNERFLAIGRPCCNVLTVLAGSNWLGFLLLVLVSIMIFVSARRAAALAQEPPPVFPSGAEAPVMRWLDRNDPFLASSERRGPAV